MSEPEGRLADDGIPADPSGRAPGYRENAWKYLLGAGAAFVLVYLALPVGVQTHAYQIPGMLAAAAVIVGLWMHRPSSWRPWLLLTAGLALTTTGDWTWVLLEANGLEPFPSVADVFYLSGVALQLGAVLILVRGRVPGGDRAGVLDALIVAVGVGLVSWVFLMAPLVADPDQSFLEIGVALAYPMLDIVMLGVLVRLFISRGRRVRALELIGAALLALLAADFGYAVLSLNDGYQTGHVVEAGWLLASVLWGTAALHPSMRRVADAAELGELRLSPTRLAVLAAASLLAPAVLLVQWASGASIDVPVIAGASVALFLLVIARLSSVVTDLRATLHQRHALESELERRALHDPLTGLANRALFHERLERALLRRDQRVAVLFLDIDDFKTVNDAYGHNAGDQVLRAAADALAGALRPADTVARLGGDEFAILLEDAPDSYAAGQVATRLMDALRTPTTVAGYSHTVAASVGIATGAAGAATAEELMRDADVAMYVSKGSGKASFTIFDPSLHADVVRGMELRWDLDSAIKGRRFELHYQPVVDLAADAVVGVEALVRWRHPSRGMLAPAEFIQLAEATGAIVPLGKWILEEACRQGVAWSADDPDAAKWFVSVNVSSVQFAAADFPETVRDTLARTGLEPYRLVLEVTESIRLDQPATAEVLRSLQALGVKLAIDDFGTGYASLSALARNPFDLLKIDRSFVAALATDPRADSLMGGVIELADRLGIAIVAEGVETIEQLARLRRLRCPLAQGYYFAAPMEPREITALLRSVGRDDRPARSLVPAQES